MTCFALLENYIAFEKVWDKMDAGVKGSCEIGGDTWKLSRGANLPQFLVVDTFFEMQPPGDSIPLKIYITDQDDKDFTMKQGLSCQ